MDAIVNPNTLMRRRRLPFAVSIVALTLAGAVQGLWPLSAGALNRCEGRDGHVTYTNEACPPNTRLTRRIDTTPPLVTVDPRGSRPTDGAPAREEAGPAATRDSKEPREAPRMAAKDAQVDRPAGSRDAVPERPATPKDTPSEPPRIDSGGRIQPATPAAPANPEQEIQRLDELRLRQERQCADLNRRIQFARADLATAGGADRASIELQLRRLEEDARAICP